MLEPTTINEYITTQDESVQEILHEICQVIRGAAPDATERICMRMPAFDMNGKWLVHFAAFKKHIGFYPQPDGITAFAEKLSGYKTSKGTVQFSLDKPIPYELIAEMTQFRAAAASREQ